MAIHPTAVVSPNAQIGENVEIGPYSIIDDDVVIGDNCWIDAHVKVGQYTKIGPRCRIYFGAYVGAEPQDHRFYKGIESYTEIGSDTVLREYVTIHRPPFDFQKTVIGNHVLLMAFVHVGHDCVIEDNVTIANNSMISGHVLIGRGAVLSGDIAVHQFVRIGALSMIVVHAAVRADVPPFCMVDANSEVVGPNTIGLRRSGMNSAQRVAIRKAIKAVYFDRLNIKNGIVKIETEQTPLTPEVQYFIGFLKDAQRGVVPGAAVNGVSDGAEEA